MKNISILRMLFVVLIGTTFAYAQKPKEVPFEVKVFTGKNLLENAFLIQSGKNLVLVDALSSGVAAEEIVKAVKGRKLTTVFITHGHPDHFLGLSTIIKNNPEAKIYVGSDGVRKDMLAYVNYATTKELRKSEPAMTIKSAENPAGFDYQRINIISGDKLDLGEGHALTIENTTEPAESGHHTILYSSQFNILLAGDLLYNKVFNWLGSGVEQAHVDNWIKTLRALKARFDKEELVIYPGHGQKSDREIIDANIHYLTAFADILGRTKSKSDALEFYKKIYLDYRGEFLLSRSIDQWFDKAADKTKSISISHIQDLTHTLTCEFPFIPVPGITFPFELTPIATFEAHGVRANKWTIHEHIGTQIDAPNHFAATGIALEELQVQNLIVPVIVVDISKKSSNNPDAELTVADIEQWEKNHGRIPDNACIMMYSGWDEFLYDAKYLGLDQQHTKHFPGVSLEAAQFLISERNISGVGVDVISFDPGHDHEYKGHKVILGAGKWALEAVANLKLIPPNGAYLFVGAPKIKGATGGIARLLAVW